MDFWDVSETVEAALREDVGSGDVTSSFTPNRKVTADITSNSDGYVSGIREVNLLLKKHKISAEALVKDGDKIKKGQRIFLLNGMSRNILPVERTVLNLLARMSGVTTTTKAYVNELKKAGSKASIAATRKTTPGMMRLEKKAVAIGGGLTHRMGLYDMILIKDNHLSMFGGDVVAALAAARKAKQGLKIEIEVESAADAVIAAECGTDLVMFDNMRPKEIAFAIEVLKRMGLRKKVILEVSGGVSMKNLKEYAKLDVDWISSGKITSAAPWLDFSLHLF